MNEDKELEEAIKILSRFINNEMQRDKLERDSRCGGWKIGDVYKHLELNQAIETVLKVLENSIPKKKIEEVKKKIKKAMNLANECIEEKIVIADSDSLNFGRKQAHNYDMELIRELLEDK